MLLRTTVIVAYLCLALSGAVCAQQGMSAEELQARIRAQAPGDSLAAEMLRGKEIGTAMIDAAITDVDSYIKWAKDFRESVLKSFYQGRDEARALKWKPETRFNKGINEILDGYVSCYNQKITAMNNPYEPFIPGVSTNKVIALDGTANSRYMQVVQIIDNKNARAKCVETFAGGETHEYFLSGLDTTGWAEGQQIHLTGLLLADGSKSYTTSSGEVRTISVMKLHAFPKDVLSRRDETRAWTTWSGETSGVFVLYDDGRVTIMDPAGQQLVLRLKDLGPADVEYVGQHAPVPKGFLRSKDAATSPSVPQDRNRRVLTLEPIGS